MSAYSQLLQRLPQQPRLRWLVTGAAGFIGSHLVETLLQLNQHVVGLDNLSTGQLVHIEQIQQTLDKNKRNLLQFIEGDLSDLSVCRAAVAGVDYVLHQGALGSVPRSLSDPLSSHQSNVTGQLNLLIAARDAAVRQLVYAGSSSTYGDHSGLPRQEERIGKPLSPYGVTKYVNELYAEVFARCYQQPVIGLRYFNVFGPRQNPNGPYAAVIPKWIQQLLEGEKPAIYGDGSTSRDFCYIDNVVQANLLAATYTLSSPQHQVYNIAYNARTSLNDLYTLIGQRISLYLPGFKLPPVEYRPFRAGDILHTQADITKAQHDLQYRPTVNIETGLDRTVQWYIHRKAGCARP